MDEISKLQGKLEFEGEHVKSLESQLKLEIETQKKENATLYSSLLSPIVEVDDGPYGGYGGNFWSDGPLSTNEDITAIEIREGHILDAIRVR